MGVPAGRLIHATHGRSVQLQEHQVEPAAELEPHFPEVGDALEAEPLVEPQRGGVVGIDSGDQHVLAERGRAIDQRRHQSGANAAASPIRAYVDTVLDGEAVAGPRPEVAERREPGDARLVLRHQHRVARAHAPLPPGDTVLQGRGLLAVDGGRCGHHLVVISSTAGRSSSRASRIGMAMATMT